MDWKLQTEEKNYNGLTIAAQIQIQIDSDLDDQTPYPFDGQQNYKQCNNIIEKTGRHRENWLTSWTYNSII